MKRIVKFGLVLTLMMSLLQVSYAQYTHSIGATVGSMNGFSYKGVFGSLGVQADLGLKLTEGAFEHYSWNVFTVELNPNLMYQANATGGLYWFVGGGLSLGYCFDHAGHYVDLGKFGLNAIGGLEYKFGIPLTLQFDFRPGFGLLFDDYWHAGYFDWGLNLGVRYTF
ncbi:MAG: hypothetical protein K6F29_02415 [Bacteroidales bacterium]|nr:hypothetical protein [Bacteroidales bacterium]